MTMTTTDDLVDSLTRNIAGKPAALMDWRELLRLRERLVIALDAEVNRRQLADRHAVHGDPIACAAIFREDHQ